MRNKENVRSSAPGGLLRVYGLSKNPENNSRIPYCNMNLAQLSFHGHKDAVRFFLPVLSG